MSRDWRLYLEDIETACEKIIRFTAGYTRVRLCEDDRTYDAVIRNLEIIGEAAKKLPEAERRGHPEIDWRKIVGLRAVIAHAYFGLDDAVLWDIVRNKIPPLLEAIKAISSKS